MSLFMNAIFLNISAGFISGGGGEGSGGEGPYDVHSIIQEIKDQLLLNENIWDNNETKLKFCERTKNLVERIEGIKIHRIDQQLFNLVFIAQMVLLWLLVAYSKYSKK
uniref:GOLD domain-containing protein n=1 Tax=Meloidogyne javanica TaxID=6303 RepID=A0A915M522_MELJA